jgi:DNA-binding response OmpR family regulator
MAQRSRPTARRSILIAEPAAAARAQKRVQDDPAVAVFTVDESLLALDTILRQPPDVVILDPQFVTTSRGAALISRVKRDSDLSHVELRLLTDTDSLDSVPLNAGTNSTDAVLTASQPLDPRGTRAAARIAMRNHVTVLVNGQRCQLVNLSITGAQILSSDRLPPHRSVHITLLDTAAETRVRGIIVWSTAESARGGTKYRSGIAFSNPDVHILETFCLRHGTPAEETFCSSWS